jgi:hypothetical protein
VPWREIKHLTRSGKHPKGGTAFDHLACIKAGWKMDPEIDSIACRPYLKARNTAIREYIGYSLPTSSVCASNTI